MSQICVLVRVTGQVQGVGFRFHTAHEGLKIGVSGYAKNLPDGSVEVLACGKAEKVEQLVDWLARGPRTSRVDSLSRDDLEWRAIDGFEII
ncbi:acylphosphatase [Photobacterium halotolerans]|uniref:Acylphosphatase n=1 Tax=Photobacterium halotolerans TaxID=265726 RepID=A0A7X4WEL0_9GAMM|nr:acylphosphatase [Photobacterium halotolerans]NAW66982.1 acylphosphatase [Photobacterium halotolerans]NAW87350.1 acylphosphatase [Photobacterium halotolerans]NAX49243.1 acylphosphatase [Photobacterium halotolerans]